MAGNVRFHRDDIIYFYANSSDMITFLLNMAENNQIQKFNFLISQYENNDYKLDLKIPFGKTEINYKDNNIIINYHEEGKPVGLYFSVEKYQNLSNYLTAGRNVGSLSLTTSLVASALGAWILFGPASAATWGGIGSVIGYALGTAFPMIALIFLGKKPRKRECYVPLHKIYNKFQDQYININSLILYSPH